MKRTPGNTLNHTLTAKGSMLEFEIAFKKKFGEKPNRYCPWWEKNEYLDIRTAAKWAWLAREKIY